MKTRRPIIQNPYGRRAGRWLKGEIHTHVNRAAGSPLTFPSGANRSDIYVAAKAHQLDFVCMSVDAVYLLGGADTFGDIGSGFEHDVIGIAGREIQNNYYAPEGQHEYFKEAGAEYLHVLTIGRSGVSVCLHPRYYDIANHKSTGTWHHIKSALLAPLPGQALHRLRVRGIEIYNGFTMARLRADGREAHYSDFDEICWDEMLMASKRWWGFAGNDAFFEKEDGYETFCPPGVVFVASGLEPDGARVVKALRRGAFYSSSGIRLADSPLTVTVDGAQVSLAVAATEPVRWRAKVLERFRCGWNLRTLCAAEGLQATFDLDGLWKYIRIQCESPADPWRRAWLQPVTNGLYAWE